MDTKNDDGHLTAAALSLAVAVVSLVAGVGVITWLLSGAM